MLCKPGMYFVTVKFKGFYVHKFLSVWVLRMFILIVCAHSLTAHAAHVINYHAPHALSRHTQGQMYTNIALMVVLQYLCADLASS